MKYMHEMSDKALVKLYREEQSDEAFEVLLCRKSENIKRLINNKVCDEEERKDLYQLISIHLYHKLKNVYNEQGVFSAWLKQVIMNYLISYLRTKNNAPYKIDMDSFLLHEQASETKDFKYEEYCWYAMEDALLELSSEEVDVIYKRFFLGWTNQQIADDLGLKLSTSIKRIRVSLLKLKGKLQERGVRYEDLLL